MAEIENSFIKTRVFKWDAKLQYNNTHPPEESTLGGLLLIRLTTLLPKRSVPFRKPIIIPCFKGHLTQLDRQIFWRQILENIPILRLFKDLDSFADKIVKNIHCTFRFHDGILSNRGPMPVIFLDIRFKMTKMSWIYISDEEVDSFSKRSDHQLFKSILGGNFGGEEIGDFLKSYLQLIIVEEPKKLDEVEACLKRKIVLASDNANPQLESFHGGLFVIRLTTRVFPRKSAPEFEFRMAEVLPFFKVHLLRNILEQLPILRLCRNFDYFVKELLKDVGYKFCFGPEILSGQGPKLVVFLDLGVTMGREAWESTHFSINYHANYKFVHEVDLDAEQIEYFLKFHPWINFEESPKGFDEFKALSEIKILRGNGSDESEVKACSICWDSLSKGVEVVETACSHVFHRRCICEWLLRANSCPLCRSSCVVDV
ncbi:hypothetical protein ACH5RR_003619 [Cinchona calisaya]|uniref:RING-type domain-containing protein n=1 Tax=Cinchona calisaya TaxID=153742 RepID=A0ABD3AVS2_9GENT